MTALCQVQTTTGTPEEAERLAQMVVEQRLAACAQVSGPISSTYWWKGTVERSTEWMCTFKTTEDRVAGLTAALRDAHPYDVPELVVTVLSGADDDYSAWVDGETRSGGSGLPPGDQ
ncbi:MAG TPA: divalent-cation tolerance protein CutA [Acidimicrobiales bacterium]|nr:divalent-cation tolerance protein CutA [Acidimicrobiales bacterium]